MSLPGPRTPPEPPLRAAPARERLPAPGARTRLCAVMWACTMCLGFTAAMVDHPLLWVSFGWGVGMSECASLVCLQTWRRDRCHRCWTGSTFPR